MSVRENKIVTPTGNICPRAKRFKGQLVTKKCLSLQKIKPAVLWRSVLKEIAITFCMKIQNLYTHNNQYKRLCERFESYCHTYITLYGVLVSKWQFWEVRKTHSILSSERVRRLNQWSDFVWTVLTLSVRRVRSLSTWTGNNCVFEWKIKKSSLSCTITHCSSVY